MSDGRFASIRRMPAAIPRRLRRMTSAALGLLALAAAARPALADCSNDAGNLIQSCGFQAAADTVGATSPWVLSPEAAPRF